MNIIILSDSIINIDDQPLELVERKGVGHPDTLSDIIAETFSKKYSEYSLNKYGSVLNHAVDKVTLLGAKANVSFGHSEIVKPMIACLFGKASLKVQEEELVDIKPLFEDSVKEVFLRIFKNPKILDYIQYLYDVHDGIGFDHPKGFYSPLTRNDVAKVNHELKANDTVVCSGYAPYSKVELMAIKIENYLNSDEFKKLFPETGFDIKVVITRINQELDVTVCVPFIASQTPNMKYYREKLYKIQQILLNKIKKWSKFKKVQLYINTKDEDGKYAYLTVFGSALDKGDQGAVGRGNRFNGVISVNREMNIEAFAGKNPVHHSGKIYNQVAHLVSRDIFQELNIYNYICEN